MNKVQYVETADSSSFTIECEDQLVLERLTMLLLPYRESSNDKSHVEPLPNYVDVQAHDGDYKLVEICGKPFAWPKSLKGNYIAMTLGRTWHIFSEMCTAAEGYWTFPKRGGICTSLNPTLHNLKLPDIDSAKWEETLTKNPWDGQEESST